MNTFWKRTFSTVVLLTLLSGSVFLPMRLSIWVFGILCCLLTYGTAYELAKMLDGKASKDVSAHLSATACFLTTAATIVQQHFGRLHYIVQDFRSIVIQISSAVSFSLPLLIAFIIWVAILQSCNKESKFRRIVNMLVPMFLVNMAIQCIVEIYFFGREEAHYVNVTSYNFFFLYFVLITKLGDIGAYVVGSLSAYFLRNKGGNHKLIPKISPGKSWEGAVGGLLTCIIGSNLMIYLCRSTQYNDIFPKTWSLYLAASAIGAVLYFGGAIGDLAESSIKRTCKVKDSGHFLPGIGGLYDLTDSLMVNAVLFAMIQRPIYIFIIGG